MEKKNILNYAIILAGMFIASAAMLAAMSAVIWKTGAGAGAVSGCVIIVYIISNFIGGFVAGKKAGQHKFLWGIAVSIMYFAIIVLAGIWIMGNKPGVNQEVVTGALICIVSGMFGGMLAP